MFAKFYFPGRSLKQTWLILVLISLVFSATACNSDDAPPTIPPQPPQGDTSGQPPVQVPLQFAESDGILSTSITGSRTDAGPNLYSFAGQAGQTLELTFTGEPNVGFGLQQNGITIDPAVLNGPTRQWALPADGEYVIAVFNGVNGSPYNLDIKLTGQVVDQPTPPEASPPQQDGGRIEFDPGTTSKTVSGEITPGQGNVYVLGAAASQIMTVQLEGPASATFGVSDSEGNLFEVVEPIKMWTSSPLRLTGDHTVVVGGSEAGSYNLTVTIKNLEDVTPNVIQDVIEFNPGADSASLERVFNSYEAHQYRLGVLEGQYVKATVIINGGFAGDVSFFKPGTDIVYENVDGDPNLYGGPLPQGGEYILEIGPGFQFDSYTLEIIIRNEPIGDTGVIIDPIPDSGRVVWLSQLGDTRFVFNGETISNGYTQIESFDIYAPGAVEGSPTQTIIYRSMGPVRIDGQSFVAEDMNFDGHTDIRVPFNTPAGSNLPSAYWLWDPNLSRFSRAVAYDEIARPQMLPNNRILSTWTAGAGDIYYDLYEVRDNVPVHLGSQSCEIRGQGDGTAVIKVIGYSVDSAGNRTITFEEESQTGCPEYKATP